MVYSPVNPWTFPVNPNFPWLPTSQDITNITIANPCVVTTAASHGYATGLNVRIFFPNSFTDTFGMPQINGQSGFITVLSPTTFSVPINTLLFDPFKESSSSITNITQATKAVVTVTTQNFAMGQTVNITGVSGMTEINDGTYLITVISGNNVTLNFDTTAFTPYVSGGAMVNTQNAQVLPIGQTANAPTSDGFTQVNPVNPQNLAQVPIFQKPGPQAAGPVSPS